MLHCVVKCLTGFQIPVGHAPANDRDGTKNACVQAKKELRVKMCSVLPSKPFDTFSKVHQFTRHPAMQAQIQAVVLGFLPPFQDKAEMDLLKKKTPVKYVLNNQRTGSILFHT